MIGVRPRVVRSRGIRGAAKAASLLALLPVLYLALVLWAAAWKAIWRPETRSFLGSARTLEAKVEAEGFYVPRIPPASGGCARAARPGQCVIPFLKLRLPGAGGPYYAVPPDQMYLDIRDFHQVSARRRGETIWPRSPVFYFEIGLPGEMFSRGDNYSLPGEGTEWEAFWDKVDRPLRMLPFAAGQGRRIMLYSGNGRRGPFIAADNYAASLRELSGCSVEQVRIGLMALFGFLLFFGVLWWIGVSFSLWRLHYAAGAVFLLFVPLWGGGVGKAADRLGGLPVEVREPLRPIPAYERGAAIEAAERFDYFSSRAPGLELLKAAFSQDELDAAVASGDPELYLNMLLARKDEATLLAFLAELNKLARRRPSAFGRMLEPALLEIAGAGRFSAELRGLAGNALSLTR